MPPAISPPRAEPGTTPFWSVMIPTYRPDPDFLRKVMESVLQQDPGPELMQIEVMDDCSPEPFPIEMIRDLAGNRISIHRHKKNLGLCGNWNSCIERARGEWIHILHQDDLVLPGFYQRLHACIKAHPEAGAAFCRHAFIAADDTRETVSLLHRNDPGPLENAVELLFSYQRVQCASIVVRRSMYEKLGGFIPAFSHALDWEMWVRVASATPILFEPEILACFRSHGESQSTLHFRSGEDTRDTADMIRFCKRYLPPEKAELLARKTLHIYSTEALDRAYALIWRRDYVTSRAQARAALHCELSLPNFLRAAHIWLRSFEQELRFGRTPVC